MSLNLLFFSVDFKGKPTCLAGREESAREVCLWADESQQ